MQIKFCHKTLRKHINTKEGVLTYHQSIYAVYTSLPLIM